MPISDGGAIYVSSTNTLINNCEFNNNSVYPHPNYQSFGGAVYCDLSNLTLLNSKFVNNVAPDGGAVFMYDSKYLISIVEFSGNKNVNMYYYDGSKYSVKVYGNNGKAVGKNQVVTIKINKKTYKVKTNKYGYAILKIHSIFA